jgi:hypothetical protein
MDVASVRYLGAMMGTFTPRVSCRGLDKFVQKHNHNQRILNGCDVYVSLCKARHTSLERGATPQRADSRVLNRRQGVDRGGCLSERQQAPQEGLCGCA